MGPNPPSPVVNTPEWTVCSLQPIGGQLWRITVLGPSNELRSIIMSDRQITIETVRLSVAAVATLWASTVGATPLACGS